MLGVGNKGSRYCVLCLTFFKFSYYVFVSSGICLVTDKDCILILHYKTSFLSD